MGAPVTAILSVTVTHRELGIPENGLDIWFSGNIGLNTNTEGRVTSWENQGGMNVTAVPTANAPPSGATRLPIVSSYNGMPTVRYDNSELTFNYAVNGKGAMTIISLSAHIGTATGGERDSVVYWDENAGWGKLYYSPKRGEVQWRFGSGESNNNVSWTRPTNIGANFSTTAVVKDGTTERAYVDGVLRLTSTGRRATIAGNESTARMGTNFFSSWEYASQEVAELLIYDRALTAGEIQEIYEYFARKYTPGPVEYNLTFNFDGGTVPANVPKTYQAGVGLDTLPVTTKEGFSFGGWFDNPEFTGAPVTTIAANATGNKVFWAKWIPGTEIRRIRIITQ
jgi:hypothetical protein